MKIKNLLLNALSIALASQLSAADLCVNESGSGGCYSSITAALSAANDGDRVLIQPKTGNAPYVENLIINKSVQLLSNQEGVKWSLTGNITISPAVGRTISIMHMNNTSGNITASGNSPTGTRCKVNIMNCELLDGYINFDYNYFNINVVSNFIQNGYIALRYGNVIGNEVIANSNTKMYYPITNNYCMIYFETDAVPTNDTLNVIGNIVRNQSGVNTYYVGILLNSTSQFFNVSNNYTSKGNTYLECYGIRFYTHKNSTLGTNTVYNNTIYNDSQYSYYFYAIAISSNIPGLFDIKNNISIVPNLPNGYNSYTAASTPTVGFSYNFGAPHGTVSGIVNNGTNNFTSNSTINLITGQLNTGSDAINGGYPDLTHYDLDLTVNDAGAYGGSFSLSNFHPITGAARVYFVDAPRTVLQSGTLNIKAEAFDR